MTDMTEIIMLAKINTYDVLDSIKGGMIWFSRTGKYIKQAEETNNNEQGDLFEGIFGRIRKSDARLTEKREELKDNLEEIEDGDYVILRRKSVKEVPIFCLYGVKREDLIPSSIQKDQDGEWCSAEHRFSDKMYDGFLTEGKMAFGLYCDADYLFNSIDYALEREKWEYKRDVIIYDVDLTKEFFIDVKNGDGYPELFHKRRDLCYQREIRYVITGASTDDHLELEYAGIPSVRGGIIKGKTMFKIGRVSLYKIE